MQQTRSGPGSTTSAPAKVVAVWRSRWLPSSETFVRDHVASLERWRPVTIGLTRVPDGLAVQPDLAPFGQTGWRSWLGRLARRTGYVGVYDRLLRRTRPLLVHAHFGTDALEALPVARRHGLPLIVTFHGYDLSSALVGAGQEKYRKGLTEVFAYASALLPVSAELERRLLDLGAPAEKIRTHYLGIPVHQRAPAAGRRRGIVFVGRLIRRKGVADLLEAVSLLSPQLRGTSVTVVGDGPERSRLEARAAALGVDAVFLGKQPTETVAELLAEHAIFCAPSRLVDPGDVEAFGLVFLEAALAGLPVVAYDHGGVPEAVVDRVTGLLAPEGDVQALSDHLASLLIDTGRAARLGLAGRRRVVEEFDLGRRGAALEDVYDAVTDR